jgi:hypothetical protein
MVLLYEEDHGSGLAWGKNGLQEFVSMEKKLAHNCHPRNTSK